MSYAAEKSRDALRALDSDHGTPRDRLTRAWIYSLTHLDREGHILDPDLRRRFDELHKRLDVAPARGTRGTISTSIEAMSDGLFTRIDADTRQLAYDLLAQ